MRFLQEPCTSILVFFSPLPSFVCIYFICSGNLIMDRKQSLLRGLFNSDNKDIIMKNDPGTSTFQTTINRKLDDVDYWRHRAGWFDDDVSMVEYNNGVLSSSSSNNNDYSSKRSRSSSSSSFSLSFWMKDILTAIGQIVGAFVALAVIIMIIRFMRRSRKSSQRSKHRLRDGDGDDRSRRSKSRSRARSKSKSRRSSSRTDDDYHLMPDDGRSHKSGRSSRSGRSRSRSKSKSRSKSRSSSHRHREEEEERGEPTVMLV
jgi:hypothetical protein